jgi:1-acyl-sn-glycerol-3-phosphate acyltransferase
MGALDGGAVEACHACSSQAPSLALNRLPKTSSIKMIATAAALTGLARCFTSVRAHWLGCAPELVPRIYFANHTSHVDFVLIWTVLSPAQRRVVRPVAGADYWLANRLRRFLSEQVFRAVLIDRNPEPLRHPIALMANVLDAGSSLIVFPEGTRKTGPERLLPFKSGLYHLARSRPHVEVVPVWIENLSRVMPKGEIVPVPLLCSVTFGTPLRVSEGEDKTAFLDRTRHALLDLRRDRNIAP